MVSATVLPSIPAEIKKGGSSPDQLSRFYKVAYDVALLAPKLILSGAGWVVGFLLGANLGAGLGDAIGTYIGCFISALLEYAIRSAMEDSEMQPFGEFLKGRMAEAVILAAGSFIAGTVFHIALTNWAPKVTSNEMGQAFITGVITAAFFAGGMTAARMAYSKVCVPFLKICDPQFEENSELALSMENFWADLRKSALIVLPAQVAFVATAFPLLGTAWLCGAKLAVLKGAAAVAIGGSAGGAVFSAYEMHRRKRNVTSLETPLEIG